MILGILLCAGGIVFIEPLMRAFGASDASLPFAKDYAFWMFVAALANLPAQSMNCAARAESAVGYPDRFGLCLFRSCHETDRITEYEKI